MIIRFFVTLLFCVGPLVAQVLPETAPIRDHAKTLYRSGQYPEAIRLYRQLTQLAPSDVDVLKEAMWGFWNMQSYEDAAHTASQVTALVPTDPDAKNILQWAPKQNERQEESSLRKKAVQATQEGDNDEALRLYRELAKRQPDTISTLHELMWALWNKKRYAEARQVAAHVLALSPDDSEAQDLDEHAAIQETQQDIEEAERRGAEFAQAGLTDQAIASYRKMLKLQPHNPVVLRTLIWALFKSGDYEGAKTYAFQLMTLRPDDATSWNILARMQMACLQPGDALTSYHKSLELDPHQPVVQIELAKYEMTQRRFDDAIAFLKQAEQEDSTEKDLYPLLGKANFYSDRYTAARDAWALALTKNPDNPETAFSHAQARYYAGDPDGAMTELQALYQTTRNLHALMFIADDLIARNDTRGAEALLEGALTDLKPSDEGLAMKLAALYQGDSDNSALEKLLDRFLAVWPDHQPSLSMKASLLYDEKKYEAALAVYGHLHHVNPYSIAALQGLVATHEALVHPGEALQSAKRLLELDPTEPQFISLYADALYQAGYHQLAKDTMMHFLHANKGGQVLPVVLYHDLTPLSRDPTLAYPYHHTVATFESHMKAIHDAGYTPVTMAEVNAWLAGTGTLPKKPIVIAFDDNRRCSFQYADPILQKYHLKATMFVALVNVDYHHPPAFVSWDELRAYQATGRWEFQSHGDICHLFVPSTPTGGQGLFLVNRQWLADQNRWESEDAWRQRIENDHHSAIQKMQHELGQEPSAFAWPEGLYGQDGNSNTADAFPVNEHLVLESFKSAWTQDHVGLNLQTKNPGHMTRLIPSNAWTGDQLIAHFHRHDPIVLAEAKLLDWASWEGKTREAYKWLADLKASGGSEDVLAKEEAEIRFAAGDFSGGMALANHALSFGQDPEVEKMIQTNHLRQGPQWTPTWTYISDDQDRIAREWSQMFSVPGGANTQWRLSHEYGRYSQPGVASVTDNALGAGFSTRLDLIHALSADAGGHAVSAASHHDEWTVSGRLDSRWTDSWDTSISGGRALYATARALDADLSTEYVQGLAHWAPDGWDTSVRARGTAISDGNKRALTQLVISRALDEDKRWRLVYRFTFDDTRFVSPAYYSPQALRLNEIGPEYTWPMTPTLDFYARYLPGVGMEREVPTQFSQDLHTFMRWHWSAATSLSPSFDFQRTPTYHETVYVLEFHHVF